MHVLIIPSEYFVPAESPLAGIFQYDQAIALRDAGVRVGVVAPELRSLRGLLRPRLWRRRGFQSHSVDGIPVLRWHGWHWSLPPWRIGQATLWLRAGRELVRRYFDTVGTPDVVHAHNARYAGMLASWIKRTHGIPYVLTEHSSAYQQGRVPRRELAAIRAAYRDAAIRFFVSAALENAVEGTVGNAAKPSEVLPNLLDRQFENVDLGRQAPRSGRFRFLNIAELNANKRHIDLLQALARVARHRDWELRIVGDGPLASGLSAESARLGISDRTTFVGRLNRSGVLAEILSCDAFVLASKRETFGVALAEALACGRPVVATASGGPDSMVTATNGFLVPTEAVDSLADALTRMMDEHSRFDPATIRRECLERYGSRRIVGRLTDAYRHVAASGRV